MTNAEEDARIDEMYEAAAGDVWQKWFAWCPVRAYNCASKLPWPENRRVWLRWVWRTECLDGRYFYRYDAPCS